MLFRDLQLQMISSHLVFSDEWSFEWGSPPEMGEASSYDDRVMDGWMDGWMDDRWMNGRKEVKSLLRTLELHTVLLQRLAF